MNTNTTTRCRELVAPMVRTGSFNRGVEAIRRGGLRQCKRTALECGLCKQHAAIRDAMIAKLAARRQATK